MTIVKTSRPNSNFVTLWNQPLQIPTLSWAAKGLWAYLLAQKEDWVVQVNQLVKYFGKAQKRGQGRDAIYGYLKELREHGLAELIESRKGGKFTTTEWVVYDLPQKHLLKDEQPPYTDIPDTVRPDPAVPDPVYPDLNKDYQRTKTIDLTNTKEEREGGTPPKPPPRSPAKKTFGRDRLVQLTQAQYDELAETIQDLPGLIEDLNNYMAATGKKYKCHAATLRTWNKKNKEQATAKGGSWGKSQQNRAESPWGDQHLDQYRQAMRTNIPEILEEQAREAQNV